MSILPEGLRRWVDLRPAGVAAAAVHARAARERDFLLFPPVMLAQALASHAHEAAASVWDVFSVQLVLGSVYAAIFFVIWRGIWSGRLPARLSMGRTILISLLAYLAGKWAFPVLAAVGVPHLGG